VVDLSVNRLGGLCGFCRTFAVGIKLNIEDMTKIALGTWAYMVLEQGALSGKYNKENPLPAESERGQKYNPVLPQLEALTSEMTAIGQKYGASCSQIGIAWAIAKGTLPIIGATKERHVVEAAEAAKIVLADEEVARLEQLADATGIDTRGGWEHTME
jgi:aryl-alcohol dehydrogenase-like predicted oxidoreductase